MPDYLHKQMSNYCAWRTNFAPCSPHYSDQTIIYCDNSLIFHGKGTKWQQFWQFYGVTSYLKNFITQKIVRLVERFRSKVASAAILLRRTTIKTRWPTKTNSVTDNTKHVQLECAHVLIDWLINHMSHEVSLRGETNHVRSMTSSLEADKFDSCQIHELGQA